ncbi:hypothetical protein PaecuDRAFT_3098 [Paenibacillus curdlanolyticus YK9]|uniref:Uncharacterized protein n=1 Tax=Paenibacillus curdlanolyticus YK9 TaxID=717606 RepID=E0IBQ9_9BACL|nr:hypothetical protein [Paenibacillus curdlanolyticus]EFM10139.1 hypothetical protein PaecuDRAFT_3098 [Paenibacillus curdlanolyticus YK9]
MVKNQVRDLEADLALCEAATQGPWVTTNNSNYDLLIKGEGRVLGFLVSAEDQTFVIAAREGWPYAIRLAQQMEREIDRLQNELQIYQECERRQRGPWD